MDVIGVSTGGSLAQHFAADHPVLLRRLVLHSSAHTLGNAGKDDPFYTPALFRETAAGIPNARLTLYEKMRHPAAGKQFEREVLAFFNEE